MGNTTSNQSTSEALDHQIALVTQQIQQLDSEIARFQYELESAESAGEPERNMEELQNSVAHLTDSLDRHKHAEAEEIEHVRQLIQDALDHRSNLLHKYTHLRDSGAISESALKFSEQIIRRRSTSNRETAELQVKLAELDRDNAELTEQVRAWEHEKKRQEDVLAEHDIILEALVKDVEALEDQVIVQAQEVDELFERLQQECNELGTRANCKEPELQQVDEENSQLREVISQLQAQITELEREELATQQLCKLEEEAENEGQNLVDQMQRIKQQNEELRSRLESLPE